MRPALTALRTRLPELADDLRLLADLLEQRGASARESALAKARTIVDKVLKQLCERNDVSWGKQNPTIENMIGPLVAAKVLPGLVAAHVRTVQSYGNLAAHGEAVTEEHVNLGCNALIAFLSWHAGPDARSDNAAAPAMETERPRSLRVPLIAGCVALVGCIGVIALMMSSGGGGSAQESHLPDRAAMGSAVASDAMAAVEAAPDSATTSATRGAPAERPLVVDLAVASPRPGGGERTLAPNATIRTGDKIAFRVTVSARAYVYLVQKNGEELAPLFPSAATTVENPLDVNKPIRIPEGTRWFTLVDDGAYGPVRITVVASHRELADLESVLATISAQTGDVRNQAIKTAHAKLSAFTDPAATGLPSRGQLELLDDTTKKTVSVRYTQRPEDDVVVAAFELQQVK